jgi:manganese transport protein
VFGKYQVFEKFLIYLVILMGLCFIVVFIMLKPSVSSIAGGLVPSIPKTEGTLRLIAAITGTTCSAAVFIMRSTVVAEKGWTLKNLKLEKRDAAVSASMMFFLSLVIMAVSAGTLHVMGMKIEQHRGDDQPLRTPGGKNCRLHPDPGNCRGRDLFHFSHHPHRPVAHFGFYRKAPEHPLPPCTGHWDWSGSCFGFGMQFINTTPPLLMVFTQAFQALILPAVAIPIFYPDPPEVSHEGACGRNHDEHRPGGDRFIQSSDQLFCHCRFFLKPGTVLRSKTSFIFDFAIHRS